MAVNVKMGVDLGGFKSGIAEGQSILKGLNAEMKATEAEFKATGNAEEAMEKKVKNLNSQLQVQKGIADQAQQALKAMESAGVKPTDSAYQKMYATMMNAKAGMNEAQVALNNLGSEAGNAAKNAGSLNEEVKGLSKKISLDQVISGVQKISDGFEKAAKAAIKIGKTIMTETLGAANWADELATTAKAYGITTDELQRMQKTARIIDTSVDDILQARQRLGKNSDAVSELFGIKTEGRSIEDVFWETGEAIMSMGDAFKQEEAAQKIFGKSWRDLVPLFDAGRKEYERINGTWNTVSDEQLDSLQKLDDQYQTLKSDLETLKLETLSELAEPIAGVLEKFNEFLNSEQGEQFIGDAMTAIKDAISWLTEHSSEAVTAVEALAAAFAGLKLTEAALNIWKFVDGAKTLLKLGGKDKTPTAPTTPTVPGTGDMSLWSKFGALGLTFGTMLSPAIIAGLVRNLVPDEAKLENKAYVQAAEYSDEDVRNVREYAKVQNEINELIEKSVSEGSTPEIERRLEELSTMHDALSGVVESDLWQRYMKFLEASGAEKGGLFDLSVLDEMLGGTDGLPVTVDPHPAEGSAQKIAQEVGTVTIPAVLAIDSFLGRIFGSHANGLPYVPYDGYLAMLHRGERVLTAGANRNYTANSNLYVENMNMNSGMDAQALAAAMSAQSRRISAGFGS